jgi:hypothetical protein
MQVIVRPQDRGALRLDHLHDQASCEPEGRGDLSITHPCRLGADDITAPRILRIFQITGLTKALSAQRSVTAAITADPHWQQTAESEAGSVHEWCRQRDVS